MKNYYYLIWVDAIVGMRKHNPERSDWKISLFIMITIMNALNLFTIETILNFFSIKIPLIEIEFFSLRMLNGFTGFVIQYASIFIILNYFLIFYNDRYKKLIKKYPNNNGKLAMVYGISSALIGFFSLILYGVLN